MVSKQVLGQAQVLQGPGGLAALELQETIDPQPTHDQVAGGG
jgi:hypothetical protein